MKLIPPLTTVQRGNAKPGTLLRILSGTDTYAFAIAAQLEVRNVVVRLSQSNGPQLVSAVVEPPIFDLSYGQNWGFHLLPAARVVTPHQSDFEKHGVLIVGSQSAWIGMAPGPGTRPFFFEVATGKFVADIPGKNECWAYLQWEIRLDGQSLEGPPIFAFTA